jgi:drug/metabolite transporter (DMT)-like permease
VGVLLYAALLLCYVASTQQTSAAAAIFLQYTAPVYVILLSPWALRERIGWRDAVTLAVCMAGIALLIAGNARGGNARGLLLGAVSGVFFGLFILWMGRLRYADPIAVTCLNNLGVALVFLPVLHRVIAIEGRDLAWLALMGAIQIALPYVLFSRGLRAVSSTEASLLTLVEPVLNPLWVLLAIGERPGTATLAGGGLIVLALGLRYTVLAGGMHKGKRG